MSENRINHRQATNMPRFKKAIAKLVGAARERARPVDLCQQAYTNSLSDEDREAARLFGSNFAVEMVRQKCPTASKDLRDRLVATMVQRREHLQYLQWRYCAGTGKQQQASATFGAMLRTLHRTTPKILIQGKPEDEQPVKGPAVIPRSPTLFAPRPEIYGTVSEVATMARNSNFLSGASTCSSSISAFTSRSRPNHLSPTIIWEFAEPRGRSRPRKQPSLDLVPQYPPLPTTKDGQLSCPYCHQPLSADMTDSESSWRSHVLDDVKPFLCLLEGCIASRITYSSEKGCLAHMTQKSEHGDSGFPPPVCPLCGWSQTSGFMTRHIFDHLRFLALKCLPWIEDDGWEDYPSDIISISAGTNHSLRSCSSLALADDPQNGYGDSHGGSSKDTGGIIVGGDEDHFNREEEWGMILKGLK
ncbi:hypothetical protein QBC43DRAFT_324253 [Cladorrhinum sp. PSN259]|nr:hypothetical protein QBC43DRAFT_324253 [Cladorrhinum sp. PSN259]